MIRFANLSNGLVYPHDELCYFQSQHGHHAAHGYFRDDAMPWSAVRALLLGDEVTVIDATQHNKPLSDALKYGVPTWCLVFNQALRCRQVTVCEWQTREMVRAASLHTKLKQSIRRMEQIFGHARPVVVGLNVHLECHRCVTFDDRPERIGELLHASSDCLCRP